MHPNKTDKGFGFNHFYGVHRNILLFTVPHQSPKSVPKCRFGRQLYELRCDCHWQSIDFDSLRGAPPPGEAMSAAAPIRYTTVNVLTKADNHKDHNTTIFDRRASSGCKRTGPHVGQALLGTTEVTAISSLTSPKRDRSRICGSGGVISSPHSVHPPRYPYKDWRSRCDRCGRSPCPAFRRGSSSPA